jgi:NAD(P)-dependent dehydrogenase (short-subunit alcohol dehydrogenase family)/2-polyprenyl-3-methyl-5-hydroxy-6-metoxy-1,4-benzoquinol methylase/acyl carrier protein
VTGKDAFAVGGIGRLRVYAFLGEHRKGATVKVWSRIIRSDPSSAEANLDICNNDGNILFTIEQLRLVKISSLAASTPRSCLYVTEWAPLQPSAEQTLTACLGLDDLHDNKTGEEEKLDLQIQLDHVVGVISGPKRRHAGRRRGLVSALEGELDRLLGRQQGLRYLDLDLLSSSRGSAGLLGAQSLQTLVVPLDPSDTALSTASRLARLFQTLHASTSSRNKDEENLLAQLRTVVVVTFGSQALVHDDLGDGEVQDASGVESSAAWGLLRTARLEFPQLRLVMVDVDPDHHPVRQAAAVLDAFHDESEDEVVWRGHCRYVPRLTDLGVDVEAGGGRAAGLDIFRPSVDVDLAEILPRDVELGQAVPIGISRSELARIRRGYALTNTLSLDSLICGVKAIPEDQVVPLQKELWQRYANVSFDRDSSDLHAQLPAVGCSDEGLDAWFDEALRSHPEVAPELNMLRPLYRQHEAVFRGDKDPLELLFRSNQHAETAGVYSESFYAQYYNRVVVHAFSSYARNWLAGGCGENDATPEQSRPMRILEVGAGSGSTSRRLLEAAAELGLAVDYYFTDISETFLRKASGDKTITATTGAKVTFTLFNAEIDPRSQGLASSTFDVVVGVNVIHATQNLYETMRHVRQLVRPRGIVILSEIVQPSSISDATFGMTEGWWRFQDRDLRPDYPLMDAARWERLLHATDFDMVRILENAEAGTAQAVVVGQAAMCSWPVTRLPTTLSSVDQAGNTGDQGVYIITGGTGGLGLLTAAVLLEQRHCDKVYLLSRSGSVLPNSAHVWERLEGLAGQGQVVKLACDVSSASQVADVFDSIRQKGEYIRGIVHSSGVLRDAMLQNQTRATMTPVFGAKVEALRWLHDLSLDEPRLRHFVIFSSASALLGSPGQANHSSANTFLDAFAAHRRAQGLPALCLQWGTVMGLGEAARKGANKLAIKFGHGQLSETAAEAVLKTVFASDGHLTPVHSLAVSPFDWNTFTKSRTKVPHITRSFTSKISPKTTAQSPATLTASSKQSTTSSTSGPVRREASSSITEMIQSCVEATISHKMPDESTTFYDAGVDSLSAIELRNRLQSRLGNKAKLSASLVFDYPTLEKLREYLESITTGAEDDEPGRVNDVDTDPILQDDLQTPALRQNHSPGQASTSLKSLQSAPEPQIQVQARPAITVIKGATGTTQNTVDKTVSIVGMDCRLPTAGNVNELWESLLAGKDGFRDIPFSRWDLDDNFYTPKSENKISRSYVKQGACKFQSASRARRREWTLRLQFKTNCRHSPHTAALGMVRQPLLQHLGC